MSEVVVETLRVRQDCALGGNARESKRISYHGPCSQAKVRGRFTVSNCVVAACTRVKYIIEGSEVYSHEVKVEIGAPPVTVDFEITVRCSDIQGKTHMLYAEACHALHMWNVDAYAEVVAVVKTTPTPTPTPTISDPWVIAMIISATIMAAALIAVALIVRK
jgi:hypothetical protein